MKAWRVLLDRLRALAGRERLVDDITEELDHHRRLLVDGLLARGLTPAEAAREADRRFGNVASLRDRAYDVRGGGLVETMWQDVKYAWRLLPRSPAFTLTAVITLALGISANTAMFSVASGVLLRDLPYPDADRLAMVWMDNGRIDLRRDWHSYPDFIDYRDRTSSFAHLAVFNRAARTLTGGADPERVAGAHASAGLFDVLGVRPAIGRAFTPAEDVEGGPAVVVISHGLWQKAFGGRSDVVGQWIELSGRSTEVIGVMPPDFGFPAADTAFWIPTAAPEQLRTSRSALWLQVIGRLAPGVSIARAQSDLQRVSDELTVQFPNRKGYGVFAEGYREYVVGDVRTAILVLFGAVCFILLIACTNVANLLLARASGRERELALRAAIGAGRARLVRQLLTETATLAAAGGILGLGLAWLSLPALVSAAPRNLPGLAAIGIDGRVLAFTLGLVVITGGLFGVVPAWRLTMANPGHVLKDGARSSGALGRALRRALVVVEIGLAVVLLVGAGLMLRSFAELQRVDLGFRPEHILGARITLWGPRYAQPAAAAEFYRQLTAALESRPGIEGAAGIGTFFLSATPSSNNFSIEGRPDFLPEERVEVPVDSITPDFFRVMRVPVLAGRAFDERDTELSPPVVIINQTMARRFWPTDDPIGRRIKYGTRDSRGPYMTIVGVVGDTRRTGYDADIRPETFQPHAQAAETSLMMLLRTAGDPAAAAGDLRAAVRAIDPTIPVYDVRPVEETLREMTSARRLNTLLLSLFGVVAALLATVGIYGVIAHGVEQRTRELGIRVVLGASRGRILGLVLGEGLALASLGLVLGLIAAALLTRAMTTMLYDVSATDPTTFAAISAAATTVSILAAAVPALRATRVNPIAALRAD